MRLRVTGLFLVVLLLSGLCLAQTETAAISGRITDQTGAVMQGVDITVINLDTNVTRRTVTNDEGIYAVSGLRPGRYKVIVHREGFTQMVKTELVLHVQDEAAENFKLTVGSTAQSFTVLAEAARVDITSAAVSTVVNRQLVENLPLNGRSFHALLELTPGVVLAKTSGNSQGQFAVNGQRTNSNYFLVDGVSGNAGMTAVSLPGQQLGGSLPALTAFGGTNNLVSVDAVEEFRVQTSTYSPEFGRSPGAQVSIVTRSGTNRLHGTLFNYFRNDKLDANDWFANRSRLPKPTLRQNDFGGVVGGPLLKDRTFFFFSYEGLRLRQPRSGLVAVPASDARQAAPSQIQPLLKMFPIPNGAPMGGQLSQFAATYSDPSSLDAGSLRIDHTLRRNLILFARYNRAPSAIDQRVGVLSQIGKVRSSTESLTGGATWALHPRMTNDLRANWTRVRNGMRYYIDNFGGAVSPPDSALFPSFATREDSLFQTQVAGSPTVALGRFTDNYQRQINVLDTLSAVTGVHQLKFGADVRRLTPIFQLPVYVIGPVFAGVAGALTGKTQVTVIQALTTPTYPLFLNLSLFAQDSWRVTPRVTITYGSRWEYNPSPTEARDHLPFALTGVEKPATIAVARLGTPLWANTHRNFAPRAGVAWQLSERLGTLLRGGFGLFYDLGTGQAANGMTNGQPYQRVSVLPGVPFPPDPSVAAPPPVRFDPPYTLGVYGFDPHLKLPYTAQWSIGIEQALGAKQTFSASYIGSVGRRLLRNEQLRNPNSNFALLVLTRNNGMSDYQGLQLQFHRRLSRGFQLLASHTWGHSIDDASSDAIVLAPVETVSTVRERASSDFDIRHSFAAAVTYNIPTPGSAGFWRAVAGNWGLDTIFRARSAGVINVITGGDALGTGLSGGAGVARPDLVAGAPVWIDDSAVGGGRRLNRAAFVVPTGRQGTLGRNVFRGFSVSQVDLSLRRQFRLKEGLNLQFRADLFNLLNHPNFGDPINVLTSGLFGQSTQMLAQNLGSGGAGGGFSPLYQIGGSRSIQLAVKLVF